MKVIHNIYKLGREAFGVGEVVRSLSKAQAQAMGVAVVLQDGDDQSFHTEIASGVRLHRLRPHPLAHLGFHPEYFTNTRLRGYDIVHQHSSWTANAFFSLLASYTGAKVVYTPHGTFAKEALIKSRFKKKTAFALYERWLLRRSSAIQALSTQEMHDIRLIENRLPVAVIPNGVDDHTIERESDPESFKKRFNLPHDRKVLLFLSRINPIKGVDLLIPLLGESCKFRASWILVLAGPSEKSYRKELEDLIREHGLDDLVKFTGPLYGEDKIDAYDGCDAFVLPSRSEAMPMVVLEAMARRKPVLVTEVTPLSEINEHQAGFRTGLSVSERRLGLEALMAMNKRELNEMGERGYEIISTTYRWSHICQMTWELYTWLLDPRKPKPHFVFTDRV